MQTDTTHRLLNRQNTLSNPDWTPKHAERSATLALSKAAWYGIGRDEATRAVFELAMEGFFQDHPHIPFQVCQSVSAQTHSRDELAMLATQ